MTITFYAKKKLSHMKLRLSASLIYDAMEGQDNYKHAWSRLKLLEII